METTIQLLLESVVLMTVLMSLLWLLHLPLKNASIVDPGWAFGLSLLAFWYAYSAPGYELRKLLIAAMAGLAGGRLGLYLLLRMIRDGEEEGRYRQLRRDWKTHLPLKFFFFFQFQALLDVVLAVPFLLICLNPEPNLGTVEWVGALVWCTGFFGETVADRQLARFKHLGGGGVCKIGLWKYSRHPNYFFQWLIWVGYFVTALGSPYGWVSVYCPLLILFFLLRITGIPATEEQALRTKGEDYRLYQRTTSPFIPWFPKSVEQRES